MSVDDVAEVQADAIRAQADCASLERAIQLLDRRVGAVPLIASQTVDGRIRLETYGVDVRAYPPTSEGAALARRDLYRARADYLRGRWDVIRARTERQVAARERASAGVDRFLPGRFSLDRITGTTAGMPEALADLRKQRDRAQGARTEAERARIADVVAERAG